MRVAVVGGGCAAMSAAFELTRPEHEGRYQVTVHQLGWRLGGKGASGRGPGDRIEEHGLHVWLGFYENAFRLLRECYDELDRDPDECHVAHWSDAFFRDPLVGVAESGDAGDWSTWLACLPPGDGEPGDPLTDHSPFTVGAYMLRTVELIRTLVLSAGGRPPGFDEQAADDRPPLDPVGRGVSTLIRLGSIVTVAGVVEALRLLETMIGAVGARPAEPILRLVDTIASGVRDVFERAIASQAELRRVWEIADLTLAILRGCLRFGLATDPRGFDAIDDYDVREWLLLNGASQKSVDSAIVRGLYDLALAYRGGDDSRPAIAAGQGIRGALRMFFTYRGALFWKMRAGMGDIVFAPFHEVLSRRGVRFRFFRRLTALRLGGGPETGDTPHVAAMEFDVQARTQGDAEYRPLVTVGDLPCWPAEPLWDQLVDGERLRDEGRDFESHWDRRSEGSETLRVGEDFDLVVLAVGGGAVPHVCGELIESNERWRLMAANINTVATQAFQLWMREDMSELGCGAAPATISAFRKPFDTWADMRHLVPEESFPVEPGAIAYFCGVLPDAEDPVDADDRGHPERERDRVRRSAVAFLEEEIHHLWPGAHGRPGAFRWDLLVAPDEQPGRPPDGADASRFETQYWRANVNPTDRYVLALPGTLRHRLSPLDDSFDNLTIAGDWTECGFNEGCVEAAVMSGRLAAHALSGRPRLEDIVGYDHP